MKAKQDAEAIRKEMKGKATNEEAIIKIIANRTCTERQEILKTYNEIYERNLMKDLRSELHGHFDDGIIALFVPPIEYDVDELRRSLTGFGLNEETLIEIIATRSNNDLEEIKKKFKVKYEKELEGAIEKENNINLKKIFLALLKARRSSNMRPNITWCENKAKELNTASEGKWGADCEIFNHIFTLCSPFELAYISQAYYKLYGHTILDAIKKEFNGDIETLLSHCVHALVNPSEYFATRINAAIKDWGKKKDNLLVRILVTRDEIDMPKIKIYYKQLYEKEMIDDIKNCITGDYKKLFIELANHK